MKEARTAVPSPPPTSAPANTIALAKGLSAEEAARRLSAYGPNEPGRGTRASALVEIAQVFANPLVLILLFASVVAAVLGEQLNAAIIVAIVLLSAALNFVQVHRSRLAAERLRQQVTSTATVLRDGQWAEVARREVVPGDVIRLSAGDLIPADAQLLEAHDLHVQQAALTGESLPVEKQADPSEEHSATSASANSQVFLGTSVVSGTATAVVRATGSATAFGDIAARLATKPPETEFERGLRHFGFLIMRTVLFLVLFVFLVSLAAHHDPFESLLFAVALAVGLTPEFLPMITTVTLGQGAVHMARQKVIVKHLAAIQNIGSMDVLCSDKTGTLTSGNMTLDRQLDALGQPTARPLQLAAINSSFETGIRSPLDTAILRARTVDLSRSVKLDEVPFDFERRRLSVVAEVEGKRLLITKGAPESMLPLCTMYEEHGRPHEFTTDVQARAEATYRALCADGYLALAVASRGVPQQAAYHASDEHDLVLAGFLAFIDPPLPDAAEVLAALKSDGVAVKILSGDNELVVRHICTQVGLDGGVVVTGGQLDRMTDAALGHVAETTAVFARVSPAQKDRILLALKHRGHVVSFLGDGINDAPSLHAADVGISVATAVDVAKDAAEIILLERSLRVLQSGILEGRRAFGNVMKYLLMGTSSNFGNMFSMAAASLFLPFLPMLPTQILLNNFLYDMSQVSIPTDNVDQAFIEKPRRWDISLIRDFMLFIGPISSLYDFLTFFVLLAVFHASEQLFHTGWFVESLATQTLVLFVIRTVGNPLRSRPSRPLAITTLAIAAVGAILPFTPLAAPLGFTPLPFAYYLFLIVATATYLLLVEVVKRRLMRRLFR